MPGARELIGGGRKRALRGGRPELARRSAGDGVCQPGGLAAARRGRRRWVGVATGAGHVRQETTTMTSYMLADAEPTGSLPPSARPGQFVKLMFVPYPGTD